MQGEGAARTTTQAARELDDAVRRVAEGARRAGYESELRVRRVDPGCSAPSAASRRTQVAPRLDGRCVACGTQTGANLETPKPPPRAPRGRRPLRKGQAGWGPVCPRCGGPKGLQAHTCHGRRKARHRGYNRGRSGGGVRTPGRPLCKGVKVSPPGKGRPCRRHALADSEYCYSHGPRRALERKAATARVGARPGRRQARALERAA